MKIDTEKIDDAVLALLYLTRHDGARSWNGAVMVQTRRICGACLLTMFDPKWRQCE